MQRRILWIAACLLLVACAHAGKPQTARQLRGMGMVVEHKLAKGAGTKEGVRAVSDAGNEVFATAMLTTRGGETSSIGGGSNMSFPRWVRVTWREGPGVDMDFKNGRFFGGTLVGDYKVDVLSRIPDEVFTYATAARGRAIVLKFRIKDDGVLFAWGVREVRNWTDQMQGGDF